MEQLAKSTGPAGPVLSKNAVIRNGKAPAAGLDLCAVPENESDKSLNFLATIAAARRESRSCSTWPKAREALYDLNVSLDRVAESLKEMIARNAMAFFVRRGDSLIAKYATGVIRAAVWRTRSLMSWLNEYVLLTYLYQGRTPRLIGAWSARSHGRGSADATSSKR